VINIATALQCEARPLIDYYRLQGNARHSAFRCYQNGEIRLVISGIGKLAAATATAYLAASPPSACHAWLNLGIAGHADKPIGELLLTHKIIDASSGQQWYPSIVMPLPCASETVTTIDTPENNYREKTMIDMEAAGFYAAAARFQSSELIHSLKVISDNLVHHSDNICEKSTGALIHDNIDAIDVVISQLQQLAAQLNQREQPPKEVNLFMEQWHFTTYQKNELTQQLRRWHALMPECSPALSEFSIHKNSKAVLMAIKAHLDNQPIHFDESVQ